MFSIEMSIRRSEAKRMCKFLVRGIFSAQQMPISYTLNELRVSDRTFVFRYLGMFPFQPFSPIKQYVFQLAIVKCILNSSLQDNQITSKLYCTVLYCTVLYCTVLYCTVLYCTVLYCTVLYCTVLYCVPVTWF